MPLYQVVNRELVIKQPDGVPLWIGKPNGYAVLTALPIVNDVDAIVLCDYGEQSRGQFRNLLRCSPSGEVIWIAELPVESGNDAYVAIEWTHDGLVANTWSGIRVLLNERTGATIRSRFAK